MIGFRGMGGEPASIVNTLENTRDGQEPTVTGIVIGCTPTISAATAMTGTEAVAMGTTIYLFTAPGGASAIRSRSNLTTPVVRPSRVRPKGTHLKAV